MSLPDGELETAAAMSAVLRRGEVTSVELVERALARAHAWQPSINAFSQLWPEEALSEAMRVDADRGSERRPYAGVPVAVKDLFDVAGHETTGCCAAFRGRLADRDAQVVERLRAAGLVLIGKTNQHELAAGGTNLASDCGRTGNPWDPARITGGSSGGSGAAVAAGVVPWALGSDTGGSIRIPAALCGCFGLKPTHGRWPLDGVMPLAPSMDCPGPMARTAADLAALGDILDGAPEPAGAAGPSRPPRIGVPDGFFADGVDPDCLAEVGPVAGALVAGGAAPRRVDGSGLRAVRSVWMHICEREFADAHPDLQGDRLRLVSPQPRSWIQEGRSQAPEELERAIEARADVSAWFDRALREVDVLVVPTTPYPAFPADLAEITMSDGRTVDPDEVGPGWMTCAVNLAGFPAVNLPAGRSPGGLPVGVCLIGRPGHDGTLLWLARRWEAAVGYRPAALSPAV